MSGDRWRLSYGGLLHTLLECELITFSALVIIERFDRHAWLTVVHQHVVALVPLLLLVEWICIDFAVAVAVYTN